MGLAAARLAPLGSGSLIQDRLEFPVLGIALQRFKFRLRLNLLRFRISNDFGLVGRLGGDQTLPESEAPRL